MGIFIDYAFHDECSEEELVTRLRRLRRKLIKLPFDHVSRVLRVDPVYLAVPLRLLVKNGYELPPAVHTRLSGKFGTHHDELAHLVAPPCFMLVPDELEDRFYKPAVEFSRTTDLWREDELPEKIAVGRQMTFYRLAFALELAGVMLRHGYVIVVQPCEGCETFIIGLSSFRNATPPCWLGSSFTKTQYATRFVEAHENICKALDMVRDEGLLLAAQDNCEFYAHRDWSRSANLVNAETTFAHVMGGLLRSGIEQAQKEGVRIEDMSDPATRNYNLIRDKRKDRR
jgi:hypothetical protein